MSDFSDVEFVENALEMTGSAGPEHAPTGEYEAKIVAAEKYKSDAGNWTQKMTFQIDGGNYRDHLEWYNLWHPGEDTKRIAAEKFSKLALVCGLKELPKNGADFVGLTLRVKLRLFEDTWENKQGETITSNKYNLLSVEKSEMKPAAPGEKPPF
tara:strand:+ start:51 stop:512 length:462 start_codon:yes stop_codon:yes gene_type:complete